MFRRSFSTTARLLRKPSTKPCLPQKRNLPPHPPNDPKPPKKEAENLKRTLKKDFGQAVIGFHNPRSEHFALAFLNPKISREKRWKNFELIFLATSIVAFEEMYAPWGGGLSASPAEKFLDAVAKAVPDRPQASST